VIRAGSCHLTITSWSLDCTASSSSCSLSPSTPFPFLMLPFFQAGHPEDIVAACFPSSSVWLHA
jgi:hypothetical protein